MSELQILWTSAKTEGLPLHVYCTAFGDVRAST